MSRDQYRKAVEDAAIAEHGKDSPAIPAISASAPVQVPKKTLLEYRDNVGNEDYVPEETSKDGSFTPKETKIAREIANASEHSDVVPVHKAKSI
jgi:hypothetical protein